MARGESRVYSPLISFKGEPSPLGMVVSHVNHTMVAPGQSSNSGRVKKTIHSCIWPRKTPTNHPCNSRLSRFLWRQLRLTDTYLGFPKMRISPKPLVSHGSPEFPRNATRGSPIFRTPVIFPMLLVIHVVPVFQRYSNRWC